MSRLDNMNNHLPRAILFDLDDTILSSGPSPDQAWYEVVARYADYIAGASVEKVVAAVTEYREWYWSDPARHRIGRLDIGEASRHIVRTAFERMGLVATSLADEIGDAYRDERSRSVVPFPGAVEALSRIRDSGVRMALITNGAKTPQRKKIDDHSLDSFFDCIVIEGEFGAGKPDERVYVHALEQLGARPAEAWMVGDNLEWEVVAPQRLGIYSIWVDHAETGLPALSDVRPDRIVRAISELG